jgi:hypothetical protein
MGVIAALCELSLMVAHFNDLALVHRNDYVGVPHRSKAMRDNRYRSTGTDRAHVVLYDSFGLKVERASVAWDASCLTLQATEPAGPRARSVRLMRAVGGEFDVAARKVRRIARGHSFLFAKELPATVRQSRLCRLLTGEMARPSANPTWSTQYT